MMEKVFLFQVLRRILCVFVPGEIEAGHSLCDSVAFWKRQAYFLFVFLESRFYFCACDDEKYVGGEPF